MTMGFAGGVGQRQFSANVACGAGGTAGVEGATVDGVNYSGALTPDALMMYCATRLRSLDDQMQSQFAKQQQFRKAQDGLTDLQNRLNALGSGHADTDLVIQDGYGDATSNANRDDITNAFNRAIDAMPDGQEKTALIKERDNFVNNVHEAGHEGLNAKEANDFAQRIGNISKDVSSSAELDMIQLQSLMSQRQTAIQMCTNLVSALGESSKSIAQKIGA